MASEPSSGPGSPSARAGPAVGRAGRAERLHFGPSLRVRARIVVSLAFLVALPALGVSVFRAEGAQDATSTFLAADRLADEARQLQRATSEAEAVIWQLEVSPTEDTLRLTRRRLDALSRRELALESALNAAGKNQGLAELMRGWEVRDSAGPLLSARDPGSRFRQAIGRARAAVMPSLREAQQAKGGVSAAGLRNAHAALASVQLDAEALADQARQATEAQAASARAVLLDAGRDQLVLFLLLLFLFPLVVGFGPHWMVQPVLRLKGLAVRIASGRTATGFATKVRAVGNDEVAEVTRAIAASLGRLEEDDHLKTRKILETRKLLRKVLSRIEEPVVVIGRGGNLDYANTAAAELLGDEPHHLEGNRFEELCFSPGLSAAIERARSGDVDEEGVHVDLETADGRVEAVRAVLGGVQDQQGRIARVVVVLHQ